MAKLKKMCKQRVKKLILRYKNMLLETFLEYVCADDFVIETGSEMNLQSNVEAWMTILIEYE